MAVLQPGRSALFAATFTLAFCNGAAEFVFKGLGERGTAALLDGFGISLFVWLALWAAMILLWRNPLGPARSRDWAVCGVAATVSLVPVPALSWLALSGSAFYLIVFAEGAETHRRAGLLILALSVPMFWARIVLSAFNGLILQTDATLVALFVGTQRDGNLVPFADGSGAMWIAPQCSAFANLSLAMLFLLTCVTFTGQRWTARIALLALMLVCAVVAINVVRIGLIGFYPAYYELIHGDLGAGIAGTLTTLAVVAFGYVAVRGGRHAPALA